MNLLDISGVVEALSEPQNAARLAMVLPVELDGSTGANRARGAVSQIRAQTDIEAISLWLARVEGNKSTFESYRKETERLVLWAMTVMKRPVSSLTIEDFVKYKKFLADPQPREQWIMSGKKLSRTSEGWRPFTGPLSDRSVKQAMTILTSMMSWLVQAGYLSGNPLKLMKVDRVYEAPRLERFLADDVWVEVKTTIKQMPRDTPAKLAAASRTRWLFSLLYLCGLRISEVVENTMGCFFSRVDNTGVEQWWIKIVGKGNKERIIPVSEELLEEARAYRRAIGLSSTPFQGESFPLVGSLTSKFEKLGRGAVHVIVKSVFEKTANRLEGEIDLQKRRLAVAETQQLVEEITERVRSFESRITRLRSASAHWLRHTAGSKMARTGADLLHVRDNLGHSTLATTSIYLHTEDDARHRATTQGSRLDW